MRRIRTALGLLALALSAQAGADASGMSQAEPARAALLQSPVWMERDGARTPLAPGALLQAGDRVVTGPRGHAQLVLPDGSVVKLGEAAQFQIAALDRVDDGAGGVLAGSLRVLKGAFRFTTHALTQLQRRDLAITVGVATIGVRGTDLWGKSDAKGDRVCLLEGHVEIDVENGAPVTLEHANTVLDLPHGASAQSPAAVPPPQVAALKAQTEPDAARPVLLADGAWAVALDSAPAPAPAQAAAHRLGERGYPVEVVQAQVRGQTWYRTLLRGFADEAQARRFLPQAKKLGFASPWVLKPGAP